MNKRKTHALLLIPALIGLIAAGAYAQAWQEVLESQFDIVETFDDLQDWKGTKGSPAAGNIFDLSDMPKKLDGSPSIWNYYSCWTDVAPPQNWIGSFGSQYTWSGTKSACIDIGGLNYGPSRLGTYWGNNNPSNGYDDVYIFHMAKIPRNEWPTCIGTLITANENCGGAAGDCDGQNLCGYYTPGDPYQYIDSWKFGTLNMGCADVECDQYGTGAVYSRFHIIPHIKSHSGAVRIRIESNDADGAGRIGEWANRDYYIAGDTSPAKWVGVEFHFRNTKEGDTKYNYTDVWMYDSDGTAYLVMDNWKREFVSQNESDKWNLFDFGGNNSATYEWGATMESPYYVDDFIVNGSRIGPSYFSLLKSSTDTAPPHPPRGLKAEK